MTRTSLGIGELARRSGCSVQGIRYYEQVGLLPRPERSAGGQRRYGEAAARRLDFIRHARELGFSLDAIRELLTLTDQPEHNCDKAHAIAQTHLRNVRRRMERLQALEGELERMLDSTGHGTVSECRVIEVLADHEHCLGEHSAQDTESTTQVSSL